MGYHDPIDCLDQLQKLQALNPDEGQRVLSDMVPSLLHGLPPTDQHLDVLEAARERVASVQAALAQRYASHPLPPDGAENETLRRVVTLWQAMARSYAYLARADGLEDLPADRRALLAQRRVHYAGMVPIEYFRARRALPHGAWAELHDAYAAAEALEVAGVRVADPLNEVWKAQSPVEAYAAVLLVDLSNPFGRSERDFGLICRWAQRFAPYCAIAPEPDGADAKPAAYALDLRSDHGLRPRGVLAHSPALRRFDGEQLASQIHAVLKQLKQGVTPSSLGLGADCRVDACSKLLLSLYRPWGLASAGRRFPRRGCGGHAQVTSGWSSIAYHVSGKPFQQPPIYATQRSVRSDISLLTFGERVAHAEKRWTHDERLRAAARLGFGCDHWQVADHSVSGFRLQQKPKGRRLEHHQLVGVRPPDGEHFLLARLSWLRFRGDGILEAGVQVLAGLPRVVAVRPFGLMSNLQEAFLEAFMLPATPALKVAATIVLPAQWFQPQRVIEVVDDKERYQLRLTKAVLRGTDFVQVGYEQL